MLCNVGNKDWKPQNTGCRVCVTSKRSGKKCCEPSVVACHNRVLYSAMLCSESLISYQTAAISVQKTGLTYLSEDGWCWVCRAAEGIEINLLLDGSGQARTKDVFSNYSSEKRLYEYNGIISTQGFKSICYRIAAGSRLAVSCNLFDFGSFSKIKPSPLVWWFWAPANMSRFYKCNIRQ